MKRTWKLLAISTALAGILALVFAGAAMAHGPWGDEDGDGDEYYCEEGCYGWQDRGAIASDTVSDLLGLSHEEIEAQRHEGKSLVEIAAAQGVSEDTLVNAIIAAKKEALQERVADGTITQEQADLMLEQMEERTVEAVNRTTTGPFGGRGFCGFGDEDDSGYRTERGWGMMGGGMMGGSRGFQQSSTF